MIRGPSKVDVEFSEPTELFISSVAHRFESAWKTGAPPGIDDYLVTESTPARGALLIELIRVDLEFRWRSANQASEKSREFSDVVPADASHRQGVRECPDAFVVEDYLQRFPELGQVDEQLLPLVTQEYRVRQLWGDRPDHDSYQRRFLQLGRVLVEALAQVDQQIRTDREAPTVDFPQNSETEIPADTSLASTAPDSIGKYRVISVLDSGGQAIVYRAVHPTLEKELVIKIARNLANCDEANKQRLVAEGKLLADLNHPNLARILDLDFHEGRPFLVMEYLRGRNLYQAARAAPNSASASARLAAKIARALAHAHVRGVLHKDIKPQNVLIDDTGEPRLIDFGLAQLRQAWTATSEEAGSLSGTANYMAPEQAARQRVDERTDIFAVGALLYYLLVGKPPYQAPDLMATLELARRCDFDRRVLTRKGTNPRLAAICLKAMAINPRDRYRSADDLASDLERVFQRPSISARFGPIGRTVGIAMVCLLIGIGLTVFWRSAPSGPRAREVAAANDIKVNIRVWRHEQEHRLDDIVPLQNGDSLQIVGEMPAGLQGALFWLDTEGKLYELEAEKAESQQRFRMTSPSVDQSTSLIGSSGTEVIVFCASSSGPPRRTDVERLLDANPKWPLIREDAVVTFDRHEVRITPRSRAPGASRALPDAEAILKADALRKSLAEKYDFISAVAFPHVDTQESADVGHQDSR